MAKFGNVLAGAGLTKRVWDERARQRADDEYLREVREDEIARRRHEAGLRPSSGEAQVQQNMLAAEQARGKRALEPTRQQTAETQAGMESEIAQRRARILPVVFGVQDAELQQQVNSTREALAMSNLRAQDLPNLLKRAKQQQAIDDVNAGRMALGYLGYTLGTGNDQMALDYINQSLKDRPGGRQFNRIEYVKGRDGNPGVAFHSEDGKPPVIFNLQALKSEWDRLNPAELVKLKPGEQLEAVRGGTSQTIARGGPKYEKMKGLDGEDFLYDPDTGQTIRPSGEVLLGKNAADRINRAADAAIKGMMDQMDPERGERLNATKVYAQQIYMNYRNRDGTRLTPEQAAEAAFRLAQAESQANKTGRAATFTQDDIDEQFVRTERPGQRGAAQAPPVQGATQRDGRYYIQHQGRESEVRQARDGKWYVQNPDSRFGWDEIITDDVSAAAPESGGEPAQPAAAPQPVDRSQPPVESEGMSEVLGTTVSTPAEQQQQERAPRLREGEVEGVIRPAPQPGNQIEEPITEPGLRRIDDTNVPSSDADLTSPYLDEGRDLPDPTALPEEITGAAGLTRPREETRMRRIPLPPPYQGAGPVPNAEQARDVIAENKQQIEQRIAEINRASGVEAINRRSRSLQKNLSKQIDTINAMEAALERGNRSELKRLRSSLENLQQKEAQLRR